MLGFAAIAELPLAALPVIGTSEAVDGIDIRVLAQPRRKNLPVFKSLADLERERKARDAQERPSAPVEKPEVAKERPAPPPLLRALVQRIELPDISGDKVALRETFLDETLAGISDNREKDAAASRAEDEQRAAREAAEAKARQRAEEQARRERRRATRVAAATQGRSAHRDAASRLGIARALYRSYLTLSDRAAALSVGIGESPRLRRAIAAARRARGAYDAAVDGDPVLADLVQRGEREERLGRLRAELQDWARTELTRVQSESNENSKKVTAETKKRIENLLAVVSAVSILDETD